jgi:hypothetical protein
MSRRIRVKPAWLDDLLSGWGRKSDRHQGWYSINPMLRDGIPTRTNALEVTGYIHMDYADLESAIGELEPKLRLAIVAAYKPWYAKVIKRHLIESYEVTERTVANWAHDAAAVLAARMAR